MTIGMNPEVSFMYSIRQSLISCYTLGKFKLFRKMFLLRHICFLCLFIIGQLAMAQDVQQELKPMVHSWEYPVSLPFSMVNKLILIPVQINDSDTLQFIFDTGLENSIICELEADEIIELKHAREVMVRDIASGKPIEAIHTKGNMLRVGDITMQDQDYIILSSNVLQLSSKMGTKIHGLLNMQAFQDYMIEIDYDRRLLTFYEPRYFRENKNLDGYASLPMDIKNAAPFIRATIFTPDNSSLPVELMLDTGAGNALSLDTGSLPGYSIPDGSVDDFLGCSINGNIKGKVGRISGMDIGPFHLTDVLVSYPESQTAVFTETANEPNGSLGAAFLRRFNLIIDYPDRKIHLIANSAFDDEFHYDMSGLEILVPDPIEHRYLISGIRKQSKAALAGIRPGDEILSINGTSTIQLNLDDIYNYLLGNDGQKIRLELLREGEKIRTSFRLEKYI
jgi:hypothetical protein